MSLHINDLFWTLQGEGKNTGQRALFVRLPYCNYNCPWCDTEYDTYKEWSEEKFRQYCQKEKARLAVITGGEPLVHKHLPHIVKILKEYNFTIACETNGSVDIHEEIDFITASPKKYTKGKYEEYYVHPGLIPKVSEWKYVVDDQFDFSILQRHQPQCIIENKKKHHEIHNEISKDHGPTANSSYPTLSLSPEYNNMEENLQKILNYIQENPHWRLSLQTHKWINIP